MPQGSILSPLLANIALSALDEHFDRQWQREMGASGQRSKRTRSGLGNWRLIRYAHDFLLMLSGDRHHADALLEEATAVLAPLGLRLAPEKTRVVHIDEGFDSPRLPHPQATEARNGEVLRLHQTVKKAIQAIKDKVKVATYSSTLHTSLVKLLGSLNRTLRGWANYFRHGVSKAVFAAIDDYTWRRVVPSDGSTANTPGSVGRNCGSGSASRAPGESPTRGDAHRRVQRHGDPLPR